MPLKLRLLEDADLESCLNIQEKAFGPNDVGTYRWRKPWSTERKQKLVHGLEEQMQNPYFRSMVAEDSATGKVIAWSRWFLYLDGLTEEEALASTHSIDSSEDANVQCQKDLNAYHQRVRKAWMGTDPIICKHLLQLSEDRRARWQPLIQSPVLSMLCTDPQHTGRGAARLLMDSGLEIADHNDVPVYLTSSRMARPLYEKFAFEAKEATEFDLSRYGGTGKDVGCVMIRPRKGTS